MSAQIKPSLDDDHDDNGSTSDSGSDSASQTSEPAPVLAARPAGPAKRTADPTAASQPLTKQAKRQIPAVPAVPMVPMAVGQMPGGALWNIPPSFLQRGLAMQAHSMANLGHGLPWSQPSSLPNTYRPPIGHVMPPFSNASTAREMTDGMVRPGDGAMQAAMWGGYANPAFTGASRDFASMYYQGQAPGGFPTGMYPANASMMALQSQMAGATGRGPPGYNSDMLLQQQQLLLQQRQQQIAQQQQQLAALMQGRNPMYPAMNPTLHTSQPAGLLPYMGASTMPPHVTPRTTADTQYLPTPEQTAGGRKKIKLPPKRLTSAERDKVVSGIRTRLSCDVPRLSACIQRLQQLQATAGSADHLAHYRDSLIRDHEELGQCRQCNRKRQLHNKWPLCLACLKHNTAHTKQFKQRYAVDPKLDLELFVFVTMARLLANSRHQCHCATGPDHSCECVFNEQTLSCIPCRFLRGVEWVIRIDLWG